MITVNNELKHYGVKGQKWGVRRYQNNDGSLTPEGRRRYGDNDNDNNRGNSGGGDNSGGGGNRGGNNSNNNNSNKRLENVSKGVSTTKKGVDDIANARYRSKEAEGRRNYRKEASEMTDQELRDAVNRLNMEESYTRMMSGRHVDNGRNTVDRILSYGGTALAVANTALGIALAIKQLKA